MEMLDTDDPTLWYAIHRLLTNYWVGADASAENTHEFYVPDGIFELANRRFEGAEQIKSFYAERAREKAAHNTSARHLIYNLRVFRVDAHHATAVGVMTLYRGDAGYRSDGTPTVPTSKPPTMFFDFEAHCVGDAKTWRLQSHVLKLIFDGRNAP